MSALISNENGLTVGIYNAVLDKLARDAPGAGQETDASLVKFQQEGTGSVPQRVAKKLLSLPKTISDFSESLAQASVAVQLAAEATKYAPEVPVTSFENRFGADVMPMGIAHNRATGRVHNPRAQFSARTFGQETMQHWFGRFAGASNKNTGDQQIRRIVISGPSTVSGVGAVYAKPDLLLEDLAETQGYSNVGVINRGQPGKATFDWLNLYLDGDLAANPDLLILQWAVNDPYFGRTVEQSIDYMRQGLARIRAVRPVSNLSIIVMTPAPMNDVEKSRTEVHAEQINAGLRQVAADFDCAFFDTYGYFQNAHSAAGLWMDSDTSNSQVGRAIHPHDVFYEHIWGRLATELVFPGWGLNWRVNGFRNRSAGDTQTLRKGGDLPASYLAGIEFSRMADTTGTAAGAPYDGVAYTLKQADGVTLQFSVPLNNGVSGTGISARIAFDNAWTDWYGESRDGAASLSGGWTNIGGEFARFTHQLTLEGRTTLNGVLKAGATADGTVVFQLPSGHRPTATEILVIASENGTCRLRIGVDGYAKLYGFGAGGTYISLGGASFKCGNA